MTLTAPDELALMRAATLLDSDPAAAAREANAVLAAFPQHEHAALLLASACRRLGDSAASASVLESLAVDNADSNVIRFELARLRASQGRTEEAIVAFHRVVESDPAFADAWRELAAHYFARGDLRNGDLSYGRFEALSADPPALKDAKVALADGRLTSAAALLRQHLQRHPEDAVAWRLSAEAAGGLGDDAAAEDSLRRSLALAPGYAAARYELAVLLYSQERAGEALPLIERLLEVAPQDSRFLSLKARTIRFLGRNDEALALAERLVADHPDDPQFWMLRGTLSREMGDAVCAVESYRRASMLRPGLGEAYWRLANLKTLRFTDQDVAEMTRQLEASPLLGMDRTYLEFALGKAHEDAGRYSESFSHYANGNARHRASMPHDASILLEDIRRAMAMYTQGFFAKRSGWGVAQSDPIFIVGLPRSGSTLLEQILASHSQVEGTRELVYLPAIVTELAAAATTADGGRGYPACIAALTHERILALAERYLSQSSVHRSLGRPRFVDKMLGNFGNVGLIQLMFPNASIIDARRHPLGLGFSCYKQLFNRGLSFSYDLRDIGVQYRAYFELMQHFDAILPGRVHRVHYEKLVASPEQEVRRLLEYCRLPFEAACLRFHENRRVVVTISSEQVRSPLYAQSTDQWRHYEPWLGSLKAELGDLIDRYP